MHNYRDNAKPAIYDGPLHPWRALVCRVLRCDRFHVRFNVYPYQHCLPPWVCIRCGARDRQGLSVDAFREAVRHARNWYAARGLTNGVETIAFEKEESDA